MRDSRDGICAADYPQHNTNYRALISKYIRGGVRGGRAGGRAGGDEEEDLLGQRRSVLGGEEQEERKTRGKSG